MKKITRIMLVAVFMFMCLFTSVYAASNETSDNTLKQATTQKYLEIKKHEEVTLEGLKQDYGSDTYGLTAYILDRVRIFSIPLVFLGLAFSAIYQYVIGLKRLDVRDKGFISMIAIITIGIICQVLPLIFTIVVTSAGK